MREDIGMTGALLSKAVMGSMETAFENWKPREKYTMEVI